MNYEECKACKGTGKVEVTAVDAFKIGDRVIWETGGWWGKKPATVVSIAKQKVRIKTDPHTQHNGGNSWFTYVSPRKLKVLL